MLQDGYNYFLPSGLLDYFSIIKVEDTNTQIKIYLEEKNNLDHFHKPAKDLSSGQCALIAATLPNPIRFNSAKPPAYILKRQAKIQRLMKQVKPVDFSDKDSKPAHKTTK
ncbi:hypothetical protein M2132_002156 [Dysgonomonas sp. PH5-45]|uniref:hypothetical protein n=1 Tax=unclassified Dysgonomonas TaxID=2630389 RepID=UPI00247EF2A9|nr:hypothetical protein [Dysgonomonas sp. PH5-45]MDH6388724.1 hypothetical protein [Dysgonomonas sp. PH5-37]